MSAPFPVSIGSLHARGRAVGAGRHGFTIIEILLVIALIGLFSTLFIVNLESLMKESEAESVETAFWEAAREARTRALVSRVPQSFRYDEDAMAFIVEEQGTGKTSRFPVSEDEWPEGLKLEIQFQKRLPASQFSLVRGQLVEMREVALVSFYPDGTCTPFTFSMEVGRDERRIEIDPWTGAELLVSDED